MEAEEGQNAQMNAHSWYNSVKKEQLSGNDWLCHFGGGVEPTASFQLQINQAGKHHIWFRMNQTGKARLSVRWGEGEWEAIQPVRSLQNQNIATDDKIDLRYISWVYLGTREFTPGQHPFTVKFHSDNNNHGGLDCMVFSLEPFHPNGKNKPGEKTGRADPGTWAFEPERDSFNPQALLDLSFLNEIPAGRHGPVRRSSDGADFVDGIGRPLRFWAANTTVHMGKDPDSLAYHARWLAKRGVNLVRHHGSFNPLANSPLENPDRNEIELCWRMVGAMKRVGIYANISIYWATATRVQPQWKLEHPTGAENLNGMLFYDPQIQHAYRNWLKVLLTQPNPHTGMPLAKDPALAILSIQNEDSLLFFTEQAIKGDGRRLLRQKFAAFLYEKYGDLKQAIAAWDGAKHTNDNLDHREIGLHGIWHATQETSGGKARRLADQIEFYTRTMRDFNAETVRYLREDLGYKGLINAGNWKTADKVRLNDAERWSYAATDIIGQNRYFGGGAHTGDRSGYLIQPGQFYEGKSCLHLPHAFPISLRQVARHPYIIPENIWTSPLKYRSEATFLTAAYMGLTGVDSLIWFSLGQPDWSTSTHAKFDGSTPMIAGMFPGAALLHRAGYIQKAPPALQEARPLEAVFNREPPVLPEGGREKLQPDHLDPLTFLAGPVEVLMHEGKPFRRTAPQLDQLIDRDRKIVRSTNRQLTWDWGRGLCKLDNPYAQGCTGFLKSFGGNLRCQALEITDCQNDYLTLLAVSMDRKPLAESSKILLQVGTTARPHGFRERPATEKGKSGFRLDDLGQMPWNIRQADFKVTLKNAAVRTARALDANGMPKTEIPLKTSSGAVRFTMPEDCLYLVLQP